MSKKLVEIKNLSFNYASEPILKNLSLVVSVGDYISIVGENGSGKSTLVKIILGLLDAKGKVKVSTKKIAYVPQRKDSSYESFPITVYELMNSYAKILKLKKAGENISALLKEMKLEKYQDKLVASLSGGQYQKLLIARSLLGEPELLILDEPSTGVDIPSQAEIYELLYKLNRENGTTIIAVEHNLRAAIKNSSHILHLCNCECHLCAPEQYLTEFNKENHALL